MSLDSEQNQQIKGRLDRGRKKLIKLDDEETERNTSKVSDTETIQNETEEKRDQVVNHISEHRLVENGEREREYAEDVNLGD